MTQETLSLLSEAYKVCQVQLAKLNVTLPDPDRLASVTTWIGNVWACSPEAVQEVYGFVQELSLTEYSFLSILLMLMALYTVYSMITGTVRWIWGVLYGFVRFSFFVLLTFGIVCCLQYFMEHVPIHSSSGREGILRK
ncbi:hypothetical protein G6F57_004209 [Rhizopus arrhizus]|nr:hypothetical protein G6F23_003601 [Rhizopus arrhizus]KAG1420758.1 hypothetical protein G6F58_004053 [Rhizopus delemar]KAG0764737.1 hypothetical protein G6F24_004976 [Rhizopus arrhizus]KAG0792861.1 hypothetical protein G6F21_004042 [Rhizopus arrhizus]KAG0799767.1 hypothetical protein G6F22_002900 [Rhizopus arrhizus]